MQSLQKQELTSRSSRKHQQSHTQQQMQQASGNSVVRLAGLNPNKSHESLTGSSSEQFTDLLRIHAFQQQTPGIARLDSQSTIMEKREEPDATPDSGEMQDALAKFRMFN